MCGTAAPPGGITTYCKESPRAPAVASEIPTKYGIFCRDSMPTPARTATTSGLDSFAIPAPKGKLMTTDLMPHRDEAATLRSAEGSFNAPMSPDCAVKVPSALSGGVSLELRRHRDVQF